MRICILIITASFLLLPSAWASEYQREDDALWLAYAPLLEQALYDSPPPPDGVGNFAITVPSEQLDELAPQFESDPRWWELRYWNAELAGEPELALEWLRRGAARGGLRFAGAWVLYEADVAALNALWGRVSDGTATAEEVAYLQRNPRDDMPWLAYEDKRTALADALVNAYPEESWPHYDRAMLHFEYGQWPAGLAQLEAGNAAPHNRLPMLFPWSYVQERLGDESLGEFEVAAGIVASHKAYGILPDVSSERVNSQIVRLNLGAPLTELQPWHVYLCRSGLAHGADWLEVIVLVSHHSRLVKPLLVDMPNNFTAHQRDQLWEFNGQITYLSSISRSGNRQELEASDFLAARLTDHAVDAGDLALYIVQGDPALHDPIAATIEQGTSRESLASIFDVFANSWFALPTHRLRQALLEDYFRWHLARAQHDERQYASVRERLEGCLRFSFDTYQFAPDPASDETAEE